MKQSTSMDAWFDGLDLSNIDTPQIIIGYGSLLSKYSRDKYSNIRSKPLSLLVNGWERAWFTRSIEEKQTYVGAIQNSNCYLNAQAFQTRIDHSLLKREKNYRFTKITSENLIFHSTVDEQKLQKLERLGIYICETLDTNLPSGSFPVNTSYVHTCLKGCYEIGGREEVERFVNTTKHWPQEYRHHDDNEHRYPRAALLEKHEALLFGQIEQQVHNK